MILILVFLFFLIPSIDPDLGWYIRTGAEFFSTGSIPFNNTYTYFLSGYHFLNPYSLYAITVFSMYKTLGLWGLMFLNALVMTLGFYLIGRIFPKAKTIVRALLFIALLLVYNQFLLGLRSQITTFIGIIAVYYVILTQRSVVKGFVLSFALFIFWANLHGGFPIGLMIIGLALLNSLFTPSKKASLYCVSVLSGGFIGSLINPFGIYLYSWTIRHFQVPLSSMIAEWTPPSIVVILFISAAFFILIIIAFSVPSKRKLFWAALLLLFSYLSVRANRNIVLLLVTITLFITDYFYNYFQKIEHSKKFMQLITLGIVFGTLISLYTLFTRSIPFITDNKGFCNNEFAVYPCEAVSYLKSNPLEATNVFAPYEWGGYLEWQLPQYAYFTDGRMAVWDSPLQESPYLTNLKIMQAKEGYKDILEKYNTEALFISSGSYLDIDIQKDSSWKEVYRDETSVIYLPNN